MADEQLNQTKMARQKNVAKPASHDHTHTHPHDHSHEGHNHAHEENKTQEKKEVKKADEKKKEKKTEAIVYARNLPISTKNARDIGKFIKYKKIDDAIKLLEGVVRKKVAVPMKGELPHRKGRGMMSGRYPVVTSKHIIKVLKHLSANSNVNGLDMDKTVIYEVIPNQAPKQLHRFGSTRFKRTHLMIKSKEMKNIKEKK